LPLRDYWGGAATYTHLGFTLAAATLGMFFLGYWVDGKIGTRPMLAIVGAFLGATGGFINLIRTLNRMQSDRDQSEHDSGNEPKE
jgi:F0F1-type ATP synthase assembly protein I